MISTTKCFYQGLSWAEISRRKHIRYFSFVCFKHLLLGHLFLFNFHYCLHHLLALYEYLLFLSDKHNPENLKPRTTKMQFSNDKSRSRQHQLSCAWFLYFPLILWNKFCSTLHNHFSNLCCKISKYVLTRINLIRRHSEKKLN